ncbi:hypothetical protein HMPREF9629_00455 [Peptoanaerobacter stomatis]|uniref:DUF2815 family protein n=1 Tax=Peptoanaerobacter stomatis TaxID=796937 RepID=G9X232_9FIRM|nr:DUF2815 family protein [Peptoanaerobacter stomatis]EHL13155.1 hypothetical protein HMPREF9629_00455 [Peptoanaerobacter stomatis]
MSKVVTNRVRFSYVNLMAPRVDPNSGKAKYSTTILLPKSDIATKQAIDMAIQNAIQEGAKGTWKGVIPPQVPSPIHDGDGVKQDGTPYGAECKGHWVFTASTSADPQFAKPEIIDAQGQPILSATEIYSGMYGRVSVVFAPYLYAGKKGIGCYLNNVQKLEDGEPLGATKASASEDFGAMPPAQAPYQGQTAPQYQQPPVQAPYQQQPTIDPITGMPIVGSIMGVQ